MRLTRAEMAAMLGLLILMVPGNLNAVSAQQKASIDYSIMNEIDEASYRADVVFLSLLGSRYTGYPGFYKAAEYIAQRFRSLLTDVTLENYTVTVPVDLGASVTVLSPEQRTFTAYPLVPNVVNPSSTPPGGLTGPLIYGGKGEFSEFNGKKVDGSIVLLDFSSRWLWKNAVILGAKAIVFIGASEILRADAELKAFAIPLNLPRLYVSEQDGEYLKQLALRGDVEVRIDSKMRWESLEVSNIYGVLKGSRGSDEAIIINAYYDSYSVVPSLSPGATDALSVAALLEYARILAVHGTPRTVIFLATSGHWQGLWGSREFVERHFPEIGSRLKMFINLDLSSDSQRLVLYHKGQFYSYIGQIQTSFFWVSTRIFSDYLPAIKAQLGKSYWLLDGTVPGAYMPYEPLLLLFENEPFTHAAYGGGITFHTTDSARAYLKTPSDTVDRVRFENVKPQLEAVLGVVWGFLNEPSIDTPLLPTRLQSDWGYGTFKGSIAVYNLTTGWYDPFPSENGIVRIGLPVGPQPLLGGIPQAFLGVPSYLNPAGGATTPTLLIDVIVKPDPVTGEFEVKGMRPYQSGPFTWTQIGTFGKVATFKGPLCFAYILNENSEVEYVSDMGVYGQGDGFYMNAEVVFKYLPVYRTASMAVLNVYNPLTMAVQDVGVIEVNNFDSHGAHIWFAYDRFLPELMVYFPPNTPTEVVIRSTVDSRPIAVLNNASFGNVKAGLISATGYRVGAGRTMLLVNGPLEIAYELHVLNKMRLDESYKYRAYSPRVDNYRTSAEAALNKAIAARDNLLYDRLYSHSIEAWSLERMTYVSAMELILDVITTIVFFFLLLVPLVFLSERLFVQAGGGKWQLLSMMAFFAGFVVYLYFFHPSFHLANNVPMILIGFSVALLLGPSLYMVVQSAASAAKAMRSRSISAHVAEIARSSTVTMAFSVGIENMRKRKFRTGLTLASITLTTFALIAFTSVTALTVTYEFQTTGAASYSGIFIRRIPLGPIPEQVLIDLKARYEGVATAAPRAWAYAPKQQFEIGPGALVKAVLAVSPEEANVTGLVDKGLIVQGRWFEPDEARSNVAIISTHLAEAAGFQVGSTLDLWGLKLRVIGIMNGDVLDTVRDLDQEIITPQDILATSPETATGGEIAVPHLNGRDIVLLPFSLAREALNVDILNIAIRFRDPGLVDEAARKLALGTFVDIFSSPVESPRTAITIFRPRFFWGFTGFQALLVPIIIAGFSVLNVMLGNVGERIREIGIFGSVGLAPLHISAMFLVESVVYAVLSSSIGYLLGIGTIALMGALNAIPLGFYPNFSSGFVVFAVVFTMVMTVASTLWPAFKAARLVTPSLERVWNIPTKPRGEEWTIPLPFVSNEEQVYGIFAFAKEYYDAHNTQSAGRFIASETKYAETQRDKVRMKELVSTVWLAPFDWGVIQTASMRATGEEGAQRYTFELYLHREQGHLATWMNANQSFVDQIRKQLLIWRALPQSEKDRYVKSGLELWGEKR
ncbi:MAG: M28 family peptidase [Candidatus Bathyarchaeia archaeon]